MPTASFNKLMNRLLGVKIEFQRKIFDYFTALQVCFLPLTTMRDIQDGICKCCRLDSRTMYWQNGFLANDMELGAFLRMPLPVQTLKVLRHIWIPATPVHSSCCLNCMPPLCYRRSTSAEPSGSACSSPQESCTFRPRLITSGTR